MNKLMDKIQKHPRSNVARAFRLGKAENGLLPLFGLTIRYFILRNKGGILRTRKESNELHRLESKILEMTKLK